VRLGAAFIHHFDTAAYASGVVSIIKYTDML